MVIKLNFCTVGGKEDADKKETLTWWECKIVKPLWEGVRLLLTYLNTHLLYYLTI